MQVSAKLKTLKAARLLKKNGLLAQQTSTLAGITGLPQSAAAITKLQHFKQRSGPFLLLADSPRSALQQAVYLTPALRHMAKTSWPGSVTLVFSARKCLPPACYQQGTVAVRVDSDVETRRLAAAVGGLLLSSSLNRRGKPVQSLRKALRYRWKRHLSAVLPSTQASIGIASRMYQLRGHRVIALR